MKKLLVVILILAILLLACSSASAPSPQADNDTAPQAAATTAPATEPSTSRPAQPTTTATISTATTVLRITVSSIPSNITTYDRDDWKHWTDADGDCQDARNEALIAESRVSVSYRTDRRCRVATGEWRAPYTGTIVTDPSKLDMDHMVPLANAHASGAWNWSAQQRERYANHLKNPQHLIAVTASANRSKGARGPEDWKPGDSSYWCQYATDWVTIKDDWNLTATLREADALSGMLDTCANPPKLQISDGGTPIDPRPTNGPHYPTPTPTARTYSSCDAAQAAGETRVQGSQGSGRGFPKSMVTSARDGDGDGVVCEQ